MAKQQAAAHEVPAEAAVPIADGDLDAAAGGYAAAEHGTAKPASTASQSTGSGAGKVTFNPF